MVGSTSSRMTSSPHEDLLRNHHAFVKSDNPFQRAVRLRQAFWREKRGYPIGLHRGVPLGTRLLMPGAEEHLWNYLTDGIRDVVRAEVLDPRRSEGKLFARPRIFDDLLSSQPLCFNLFGELKRDLALASRVLGRLAPSRVKTVHRIEFEYSPGRRDPRYTADRSAFDVYVEYESIVGKRGFLGVEVKYHEDLNDALAPHRERYDEVAQGMGCFHPSSLSGLRMKPINQLWRDRKHHQYVTTVVDHVSERVVWAAEGKNAATVGRFFDELGLERTAGLRTVTLDMSAAYVQAVESRAPHAQLVFDRFHVQRLAQDALDELRRAEVSGC